LVIEYNIPVAGQEVTGQGRAAVCSKFYSISHQEQIRVKDIIWNILNLVSTYKIYSLASNNYLYLDWKKLLFGFTRSI